MWFWVGHISVCTTLQQPLYYEREVKIFKLNSCMTLTFPVEISGTYNIFDNVRYLDLIFKNMTFYLHLKIQNINANALSLTFSRWPWLNNVILKDLNTKHILAMQYDVRDMFPEYLICKFEKITDALVPTYTFY